MSEILQFHTFSTLKLNWGHNVKVSKPSTTEDDTEEKLNKKKVRTYGLTTQDILEFC